MTCFVLAVLVAWCDSGWVQMRDLLNEFIAAAEKANPGSSKAPAPRAPKPAPARAYGACCAGVCCCVPPAPPLVWSCDLTGPTRCRVVSVRHQLLRRALSCGWRTCHGPPRARNCAACSRATVRGMPAVSGRATGCLVSFARLNPGPACGNRCAGDVLRCETLNNSNGRPRGVGIVKFAEQWQADEALGA